MSIIKTDCPCYEMYVDLDYNQESVVYIPSKDEWWCIECLYNQLIREYNLTEEEVENFIEDLRDV